MIAKYFNTSMKDLLIEWLSDKIVYDVEDNEYGIEALKVAEQKVKYKKLEK